MISHQEYVCRQDRLLAQCQPESLIIVPAANSVTRSRDTEYLFRQDSDFWYLTGFNEPNTWLLLSNHSRYHGRYHVMILQPKDPFLEVWEGRRLGAEAALAQFDLDEAFELPDLADALRHFIDGHQHLYYAQGHNKNADKVVFGALDSLRNAPKEMKGPANVIDIRPLLHEMRLFKSGAEIAAMQVAADISVAAHIRAMKFATPGCYEFQLEAEIHHEFAMSGARQPAYNTIVGSGDNGCILHYTENSDEIVDGDLVLIDAGAEYKGYAADITRTFPVNGQFSKPQAQIYQLVLDAQQSVLDMLCPGVTLPEAMNRAAEIVTAGLIELNILTGSLSDNLDNEAWKTYFMHGIGHYLGLDVHDVGDYKQNGQDRPLKPGMVLTIEPGIYIAPDADVPEQFKGIGVRIEDNVVMTATGIDILTQNVPKTIQDIETLMK